MTTKNLSFLGLADVYLKLYDGSGPAVHVGSVSQCDITHSEENLRQRNNGRDGGTLNTVARLDRVGVAITFQSLSIPNLARALRGTISDVAADSVTDEEHTAYKGALIRTEFMDISSVTVTDDEATPNPFTEGTDFRVTGAGIVILEDGTITDETTLLISYDYGAQRVVEALTEGQKEYTLYFDGLNEADGNRNVAVDIHRIKFGLPETLQMISDEYATLATTGEALLDPNQTGQGSSKFYRWAYPTASAA
ncbi:MAG: hypothetical protein RJP96_02770 [Algiphilus sp.]|uniref:phage tail tube protein n=1 Tax=Algiphilus sp. TaxID=1872431 RepID=UPI0032F012C5